MESTINEKLNMAIQVWAHAATQLVYEGNEKDKLKLCNCMIGMMIRDIEYKRENGIDIPSSVDEQEEAINHIRKHFAMIERDVNGLTTN